MGNVAITKVTKIGRDTLGRKKPMPLMASAGSNIAADICNELVTRQTQKLTRHTNAGNQMPENCRNWRVVGFKFKSIIAI